MGMKQPRTLNQQPNMNGDSVDTLIGQQVEISAAAEVLLKLLGQSLPHGRNYQTLENGITLCQDDRAYIESLMSMVSEIERNSMREAKRLTK